MILDARDKHNWSDELGVGDWVRIHFGWYRGDLGRIREVDNRDDEFLVAVVPRIPSTPKQKRPRPAPALFSPIANFLDEMLQPLPGSDQYLFRGRKYVNGLCEIVYSSSYLIKATPTLQEIGLFSLTEPSLGHLDSGEPFLQHGDKVVTLSTGLRGFVSLILGDMVGVMHATNAQGEVINAEFSDMSDITLRELHYHLGDVRRVLEVGMNVRVMVGQEAGRVGMIIGTSHIERGDIVSFITNRFDEVCSLLLTK